MRGKNLLLSSIAAGAWLASTPLTAWAGMPPIGRDASEEAAPAPKPTAARRAVALPAATPAPAQPAPHPAHPAHPAQPAKAGKPLYGGAQFSVEGADVSESSLQAMSFLVDKTKPGPKRDQLVLNRAQARFLRVRRRITRASGGKLTDIDRKELEDALKDVAPLDAEPKTFARDRDRAGYLAGVIHVYLDRSDEAQAVFMRILERNPKFEKAGTLGVFVAEAWFEKGDFPKALDAYRRYYSAMSVPERQLALYKMAWSYLNLKRPVDAETCFKQLIKQHPGSEFARDSARDLASVICRFLPDRDYLALGNELFPTVPARIAFLDSLRRGFEAQGAAPAHNRVTERLLALETDPRKQLELRLALARMARQTFAARAHLDAFRKVVDFVAQAKLDAGSGAVRELADSLENESGLLIKNFADAFSGRVRPPEPFTQAELGGALLGLFAFSDKFLPDARSRPSVLSLELDVCASLKRWDCVVQTSDGILEDAKRFGPLADRARLDRLVALEALAKADPKQRPKLVEETGEFHREHAASPEWVRISVRHAELLIEDKRFEDALPVAEAVHAKAPSAEAGYRVQWARFQLKKHSELLGDAGMAAYEGADPRFVDLKREASLELARSASQADDTEGYRKNIESFIRLAADPRKARIARREFLAFVASKDKGRNLPAELLKLPPPERFQPEYSALVQQAWRHAVLMGDPASALQLLPEGEGSALRRAFTEMSAGRVPSSSSLRKLGKGERDAVLKLLVLAQPEAALRHFDESPPRDAAERGLAELGLKLSEGGFLLAPTPRAVALLGREYRFPRSAPGRQLPIEERMARIAYPDPAGKGLEKKLGAMVEAVRQSRKRVPASIKDQAADSKVRVLRSAARMESEAARVIRGAPQPEGLTPEQQKEYVTGIEAFAGEFDAQAAEFGKLADAVGGTLEAGLVQLRQGIPAQPKGGWSWPKGDDDADRDAFETVKRHAAAGNRLAALAVAELARQREGFDPGDYFRLRAGAILAQPASEVLRHQLAEELKANGQHALLEEWKKESM